ncbi:MAG TPA: isoaspartyl peptidase/L-asparaginase family protein [Allosphingosinicella sp.]|nr:isoaspartyl peptidase/L-asparaginase family protein [Allosphingosinicella sp.]
MEDLAGAAWALIVHGGAKEMAPGEEAANRDGVLRSAEAGAAVLRSGGSALDSVETAIRMLEDLPVFNAGRGSVANAAGEVEMCAGLMDGRDLSVGAVGAIRQVRNPISVARRLIREKEVILVGEGALLFALEHGAETVPDEVLLAEEEKESLAQCHDTVGAVALDLGGNLAAGTSTGGLTGARVGRIGDSPLPGSGLYADNHAGAVAFSGDGESIARLALAARVMARIADLGPEQAVRDALERLPHVGGAEGDGGGIAIAKDGRVGWWHNSPHFAVAVAASGMAEASAWLKKGEAESG